jgi:excisionase family DNA binding protein
MSSLESAVADLRALQSALRERGVSDLSEKMDQVIAEVSELATGPASETKGKAGPRTDHFETMTTGEAARFLGIKSVNTIKRWVRDGLLDGFQRGGRVVVSKESVQRMVDRSAVRCERDFDQRMEAAAEFGAREGEPTPDSDDSMVWSGRKPWEQDARARTR